MRFVEELRSMLDCGSPDGRVRYREGLDSKCRSAAERVAELVARMTGSVMHPVPLVKSGVLHGGGGTCGALVLQERPAPRQLRKAAIFWRIR